MILKVLPLGPFQANCFILADKATRQAAVIDPGDEPEKILRAARGLEVKVILLTHGHLDHVSGARRLKEETGAPLLIHAADRELYEGLRDQYAAAPGMFGLSLGPGHDPLPPDGTLEDGQEVAFGPRRLRVLHTPGHTPGCCCLLGEGILFSGDTLFFDGVGRTDLAGGDEKKLRASLQHRLMVLPSETRVFPGHGPFTTIEREKKTNPFMRAAR